MFFNRGRDTHLALLPRQEFLYKGSPEPNVPSMTAVAGVALEYNVKCSIPITTDGSTGRDFLEYNVKCNTSLEPRRDRDGLGHVFSRAVG